MNGEYSIAVAEVLDILEHTRREDVEKISKKFIDFLRKQSDKNYVSKLDHTKSIKEMNLKPKTKAILGMIYLNYWADEEGKKKFKVRLKENEEIYQKELSEKYNVENMFNKRKTEIKDKNTSIDLPAVIKKETFWQKVLNKIKSIFFRR